MCNVILTYNEDNALARRKLAALLATGLFTKVEENIENEEASRKRETEEFLYGSKVLATKAFARHL